MGRSDHDSSAGRKYAGIILAGDDSDPRRYLFYRADQSSSGPAVSGNAENYSREEKRISGRAGEPFQIWMRGQGLAATGFLLDLVHKYSTTQPVYLSEAELAAVSESKQFIRSNLSNMPSVLELCKRVAMNKNKLQKAFRLTEGKSIGEYVRTLRMEQALELLEQSDMTVQEIAAAIGYHGVSNFYHAFQQKFGSTPQAVRDMLKK